ncbi:MAG: hypothetical protein M1576_00530, partial [Deltaproteobacteria bacterium]|nr:hypothetical protein [Deltaproteobacteria bacterium]
MNKSNDSTNTNNKEVLEKIKNAYRKFLKNDSYLLKVGANERSITHRLAIYLEDEFPDYNVDCEYNREGADIKRIREIFNNNNNISQTYISITDKDGNTKSVFPDIIIHHRGTNDNFIVIEAKKTTNNCEYDEEKLKAYKTDLKYKHAFFIKFPVAVKKDFVNFNGNIDRYI